MITRTETSVEIEEWKRTLRLFRTEISAPPVCNSEPLEFGVGVKTDEKLKGKLERDRAAEALLCVVSLKFLFLLILAFEFRNLKRDVFLCARARGDVTARD